MQYRKKPVVIEAIQYNKNPYDILDWAAALDKKSNLKYYPEGQMYNKFGLFIETLEGLMHVSDGDFVIQGVNGEFYPCKPDIFEKTYEKV